MLLNAISVKAIAVKDMYRTVIYKNCVSISLFIINIGLFLYSHNYFFLLNSIFASFIFANVYIKYSYFNLNEYIKGCNLEEYYDLICSQYKLIYTSHLETIAKQTNYIKLNLAILFVLMFFI